MNVKRQPWILLMQNSLIRNHLKPCQCNCLEINVVQDAKKFLRVVSGVLEELTLQIPVLAEMWI